MILILVLAGWVRFRELGSEDFWLDELHSMINSAGLRDEFAELPMGVVVQPPPNYTALREDSNLISVWDTMRADSHPPLYFLLLNLWRRWLGDDEGPVRALSSIFSVLSLVPVAYTFRNLGRARAGLIAAVVLALAFSHIRMAQENRPYGLALLCSSLGFWALTHIENVQRKTARVAWLACSGFTASVFLSLFTHYFSALVLLAQGIYGMCRLRGTVLRVWLVSCGLGLGLFAWVWWPSMHAQLTFIFGQEWLTELHPDHVPMTFARLGDLSMRLLLPHKIYKIDWRLTAAGVILVMACVARIHRRRDRTALPFLLWFGVPALAFAILDLTRDDCTLKHLRYPAIAVPGIAGLVALAIDGFRTRVRAVLLLAVVSVAAATMEFPSALNPEGRLFGYFIRRRANPEDLLVYSAVDFPPHWLEYLFAPSSYYFSDSRHATILLTAPPTPEIAAVLRAAPRIFVISTRLVPSSKVIPDTHELTWESNFIFQLGKIYELTRRPTAADLVGPPEVSDAGSE